MFPAIDIEEFQLVIGENAGAFDPGLVQIAHRPGDAVGFCYLSLGSSEACPPSYTRMTRRDQ